MQTENRKGICCLAAAVLFLALNAFDAPFAVGKQGKANEASDVFKVQPGLEDNVNFWKKIYSQYTTDQVLIHDGKDLSLIYEVLNVKGLSARARGRRIREAKAKYKKIMRTLAVRRRRAHLSREAVRIKELVKDDYYRAARRIRGQLGQADRFRAGLARSGRYETSMKKIFQAYHLPPELTALPHVESSFQTNAYSKFGAAGIWQFTRSTGRLFMTLNYEVDERRDPLASTEAAARLLKKNYEELGSWSLAITAYNHGLNGMKRAKGMFGDDIVKIIKRYRSRVFGFASRNFYCEFLAALDVEKHRRQYFPGLKLDPPFVFDTVRLDHYYDFQYIADRLGLSPVKLAALNPSLRPPVLNGEKRVPKGIRLRVPQSRGKKLMAGLKGIPEARRFEKQKKSTWYKVRRGDTLGHIARRFGASVIELCRLNNIRSRKRIYAGQVLRLPRARRKSTTRRIAAPVMRAGHLQTYRVRRNDNIYNIARSYGMKPGALLRFNGLKKGSLIYPGQVLRLRASTLEEKPVKSAAPPKAGSSGIRVAGKKDIGASVKVVTVKIDETLGHYSEWAGLPVRVIRRTNKLRRRRPIRVGDRIKLVLNRVTPKNFEERRREYHLSLRQDFYANFEVKGTEIFKVKSGQNLWEICQGIYGIPYWLLKEYNPEVNMATRLMPGQTLNIPIVTSKSDGRSST